MTLHKPNVNNDIIFWSFHFEQNSSASLAERHLGPESQLVGHSFQQEFLSELETGMELLQGHAQQILGNALSHAIQQLMETQPSEAQTCSKQDYNMKVCISFLF